MQLTLESTINQFDIAITQLLELHNHVTVIALLAPLGYAFLASRCPQARSRATSEAAAVKSISKAKLVCKEDVKDVQAEVAIMNLVGGHPHVVTLMVSN